MAGERYLTQDHELIREWAEAREGTPTAVASTGSDDDPGIIRIDFPDYTGEGSLEEISWDEWFRKFDDNDLVLLFQETTSDGEQSNFNKLVASDTAEDAEENAEWRGSGSAGGSGGGSAGDSGGAAAGGSGSESGGGSGSSEVELRGNVEPSDEATPEGLKLARAQGEAVGRAVRHMAEEVADDGGEKAVGDYIVGYAVEEAEGMYQLVDGQLEWQDPDDENLHVEIAVRDRDDGRLVPGLEVEVTLLTEDGKEVGTHVQPFLWHPSIHHYGRNWKVPGDGRYTIRVRIPPAPFPRHDEANGRRYGEEVVVAFEGVEVETGQD